MLLWDEWGLVADTDPPAPLDLLDQLARDLADPPCPGETLLDWSRRDGCRVPATVTSYSPAHLDPLQVDVSRVVAGGD